MALHVYYRKKYLRRSLTWYFIGLVIWLGIYFKVILSPILNRHQNVGEITHLILGAILTIIFVSYLVKLISVLVGCISEYSKAPSIAYSFTIDGVSASRKGEFISWNETKDAASMANSDGIYLSKSSKSGFSFDSWGISPDEIKKAKGYIYQTLPKNKTKRLNF